LKKSNYLQTVIPTEQEEQQLHETVCGKFRLILKKTNLFLIRLMNYKKQ
jgi:hypothetical protein